MTAQDFEGRVAIVTGAAMGIGAACARAFAQRGARVVIADFDADAGEATAQAMVDAGYTAIFVLTDVTSMADMESMAAVAVERFGGIDILVNNASAISLTGTLQTPMKRFDLMNQINARGTFMVSQKCIPHLLKATNPHVLNLSPPLDFDVKWFANHAAYTLAKFGMSVYAWAMAEEFKGKIAFNCLWPRTGIATAAIQNILGGEDGMKRCRKPEIMADAAYAIFNRPAKTCTGNFFIDDEVLAAEGVTNFDKYAVSPGTPLMPDFFVPAQGARTVVGRN
jgi:citronellol/citronellal dehydrogenase